MNGRTPAEVFPPGEFIRDEIEARGWTQTDFAEILGRPFRLVNEIISGKRAITPETAFGLGEALGTGPQFWMNLESSYRLSLVEREDTSVAQRAKLYAMAPIKDMVKRGWIDPPEDTHHLELQLLHFFEIDSIDEVPNLRAAARKSTSYAETSASQVAWLYRAKQLASALEVPAFEEGSLIQVFDKIRKLIHVEHGERRVSRLLGDNGIRFVVVEHLSKTKLDGAAFWLDDHSPVVALSLRFDRIDAFWHTLVHELAHIHNRDGASLDDNLISDGASTVRELSEIERKADEFACNLLVPKDEIESFIARTRPYYSKASINKFANRIHVNNGIILGQLQRRGEIKYSQNREMLVKIRDEVTKSTLTDGWNTRSEVS